MAVLKARISGAWVPVGGGPSGGGTDEVVVSATEPPLAETELWYDTSAPAAPFGLTANPNNALGIVEVGQVTLPINQSSPAIGTEITSRLNYVLSSNRRYRLVLYIGAFQTGGYSMDLHSGGAATGGGVWMANPANQWGSGTAEFLITGNNISQGYSIKIGNIQGTPAIYHVVGYDLWYLEDLGPTGSPALPIPTTPPAWIPMTFENGWQNYPVAGFAPGSYRKIGDEVQLRGLVMGGTVNTAICTLPVGFRPAVSVPAGAALHLPVVSNAAFGWVHVYASGVLNATSVSSGWVDLSPLRFSVTY